jgi:hypothetical protein
MFKDSAFILEFHGLAMSVWMNLCRDIFGDLGDGLKHKLGSVCGGNAEKKSANKAE